MDKKMLFIYNPRAGKAQIRSNLLDIIDIFVKAGYEVTAYPTQASGDAVKAVKTRRAGYDIVVCSGVRKNCRSVMCLQVVPMILPIV